MHIILATNYGALDKQSINRNYKKSLYKLIK